MTGIWETVLAVAAVGVSVGSAVVAVLARRDSRSAAKAAEDTVALERERRHEELAPLWTASVEVHRLGTGFGDSRVRLALRLDGPAGLQQLNRVVVRIRDNETHTPVTAGGPTQEELDAVVWGPYHLVPGVDGADPLGRTCEGFPLGVGEERVLELKPSPMPGWMTDPQAWADQYHDAPIRLEVECQRAGIAPWTTLVRADQPQPKFLHRLDRHRDGTLRVAFDNAGTGPARHPALTTDRPGHDAPLLGRYQDTIEPGQATQTLVIANTYDHIHEWVELSWVDPRGARDTLKGTLPA